MTNGSNRISALIALPAAFLICAVMPSISNAAQSDAARCVSDTPRETFNYWPNGIRRAGDPRAATPVPTTAEERRAHHEVFWPTERSAASSIRQWLLEKRFDCMEQAFEDLDRPGVVFPTGKSKVIAFLSAVPGYVAARQGLTSEELDALLSAWRAAQPTSILPDILGPRLFEAAAWEARGTGYANTVTADGWATFRRFNEEAQARLNAAGPKARAHLMWSYVALRVMAGVETNQRDLEAFSLEALRRLPDEIGLALVPAGRLVPQWGGSPEELDRFASLVYETTRARHGARAYALIYTSVIDMPLLPKQASVRVPLVRQGLIEAASAASDEDIYRLQMFACAFKDEQVLSLTQELWRDYAKAPHIRGPASDLPGTCRTWAQSLKAS